MPRISVDEETVQLPIFFFDSAGIEVAQETLDRWAKCWDEFFSVAAEIRAKVKPNDHHPTHRS